MPRGFEEITNFVKNEYSKGLVTDEVSISDVFVTSLSRTARKVSGSDAENFEEHVVIDFITLAADHGFSREEIESFLDEIS